MHWTCRRKETVYHHFASWSEWARKWVEIHFGDWLQSQKLARKHAHIYTYRSFHTRLYKRKGDWYHLQLWKTHADPLIMKKLSIEPCQNTQLQVKVPHSKPYSSKSTGLYWIITTKVVSASALGSRLTSLHRYRHLVTTATHTNRLMISGHTN